MKLVVVGARGRLGALVTEQAAREGVEVVACNRGDLLAAALATSANSRDTVVVDVATAGTTAAHARACADTHTPYLVATTGLSPADLAAVHAASIQCAVLVAANLSVSAHVCAALVRDAALRLRAFDVEIVELHHNKKQDAPSGTALMLAAEVAAARGLKAPAQLSRHGKTLRQHDDVAVHAVRGGDVVGEHTVYFFGEGERVEIAHRVSDRTIFARGALAAARFLAAQQAGLFTMGDVVDADGRN